MSKSTYILTFLMLFLITSITGFSQNNNPKDSTVLIISSGFEPFLSDAFKIKENPKISDTSRVIPKLTYRFLEKQIPVTFQVLPITAAKIKGEPLVKLYRGYAKVGIGTNTTPLAEFYYNTKRSKTVSFGVFGKHFSSRGIASHQPIIETLDATSFSNNQLSVFGKHFSKTFTIGGKVGYNRYMNHYYGIGNEPMEEIAYSNEYIKQKINQLNTSFSLARNFTDSAQFDYNVDLDFYHLKDRFEVSENHLELAGNLSKYHKQEHYSLGVEVNYNKLINPLSLDNNLVLGLNPTISTSTDMWQFQVGIGLYLNSFPDTKFHFYPKAEFKYNVVENIMIPYVGIKGGLISNNLNDFYAENPFINTVDLINQNTNQKYDIYGGIRGSLSSKVTFNTSFSQQKMEGMPLYVKDWDGNLENKFLVAYDTVNVSTITGELAFQQTEKIKLLVGGKYFSYDPKNEIKAWHKPNLELSFSGIYDLADKIVIRADLFYFSKQYAKKLENITTNTTTVTTTVAQKLKGIFDANIGIEYRYTKKLSAFINFNNIGAVQYQKFQDYPTQRFGVLGGLTYSF